ncbi:hypothetical protein KEJ39_06035 [Candidatus Bathyarchaeota archaeon]|nr:hypothetical protein [Candidatus Bathyarchaeota archaeon]
MTKSPSLRETRALDLTLMLPKYLQPLALPPCRPNLSISLEPEGWYFSFHESRIGPYETISEVNPADVGRFLGVPTKEVLKQILMAHSRYHLPLTNTEHLSNLLIKSDDGKERFTIQATIGSEVNPCGFIVLENNEWIAAETTYLYGELEREKKGEIEKSEGLQPIMIYSLNGQRNLKLLKDSIFKIGQRALRPKSTVLGTTGLNTLMILSAVQRFLRGEHISPNEWFRQILSGLRRFCNLDFDTRLYDVVPCIVMSSYFYDLFGVFPIITIFGPYESGKGRLLQCITLMGHRGMLEVDPTNASLFRSIEAWKPLLGIDEFHEISHRMESLLKAGYKKGTRVPRIEKTKAGIFYLSLFDIFSKIVIASDKLPPSNILQKGIKIVMRKMPDPNPEKRDPAPEDFEEIRSQGYMARLMWPPAIKEAAEKLNQLELGLSGRDFEVWKATHV